MNKVPSSCSVCGGELEAVRLQCRSCGTALEGHFDVSPFARLTPEQHQFLVLFLKSRGIVKEVERALGLSYPTVRSRLQLTQASGDAAVTTRRGDVSLRSDRGGRVAISAMRGDISVRIREFAAGGSAAVRTLHGDVSVAVPASARCRFDASTLSGDVRSSLPLQQVVADRRRLSGVLNTPDVEVAVSTTHGDVTLLALEGEAAVAP